MTVQEAIKELRKVRPRGGIIPQKQAEAMSRLTEWIDDGENRCAVPRMGLRNIGHRACCNKLAHYEDLEEQGLLMKLRCKVEIKPIT